MNLAERDQATLWLEVSSNGDTPLRQRHPIELLAYNEWSGVGSLPESLAAFVLPNHPAVDSLLKGGPGAAGAVDRGPGLRRLPEP